MVKSLTELHGGRAEVGSAGEGKGATFRVFLPLHGSSDFASSQDTRGADPSSPAGLRVLLVDDDQDSLETFRLLLEHAGSNVTCAASAKEALALAERGDFDVLISDIGMPHMNGYQMLAELRRRPRTATLPAIALTGYGRSEDAQHALAAGFQAHVGKPVNIEHFQSVMAAVIAGARTG